MKKKKTKFLINVVIVLFTIYMLYNLVLIRGSIRDKQKELDALNSEVHSVTLKNQQLENSLKTDLTDEEIADIAREKLGFSLPGERIFIDITGK
ncbi:MAG: hypothetical protein GX633_06880 [Clostridiales bacterium]|nr:hypothetical protein [Clostridiales bacterium]